MNKNAGNIGGSQWESNEHAPIGINDGLCFQHAGNAIKDEDTENVVQKTVRSRRPRREIYTPDINLAAQRRTLADMRAFADWHPLGPRYHVKHPGYVYFARAESHPEKLIKIGYSDNPVTRCNVLTRDYRILFLMRSRITLQGAYPGDKSAERYAHTAFEEFNFEREWFLPAQPILDVIAEIQTGQFIFRRLND